jgi:DNA topoisomerase II
MSKKQKNETYSHMSQLEHVYKIPDTYIGSIEPTNEDIYIYEDDKIVFKNIIYIQGFYKIFDELLVNALDQYTRTMEAKNNKIPKTIVTDRIEIDINKDTGYISILNTGDGFVIEKTKIDDKKLYSVEMVCGVLLTSGSYEEQKKIIGSRSGFGIKLTNIFSKEFTVETVDKKSHTKYIQTWTNNMNDKSEPIIEKQCKEAPYTKITFLPDYQRFSMNGLNNDIISLLVKRVYDACLWTCNNGMTIFNEDIGKKPKKYPIDIYLNNDKLECNLENYINIYNTIEHPIDKKQIFIHIFHRWEVAIIQSPNNKFNQVSMVNGITTNNGGKYVDHITTQFTKKCLDYIKSKKKNLKDIKPSVFKDYYWVFIKHIMESPAFDSQTKMYCSTNIKDNKFEFDDKFIEKFVKNSDIISKLEALTVINDNKVKTPANKIKSKVIVPKLDDANFAGSKKSQQCTLILTEGDSAKSSAISGLSIFKNATNTYGVFPLKGKLLNVREETLKKIQDNDEISNIMKILGLNFNTEYKDTSSLRYSKIIILTDQDVDGFHIKGLLINLFDTLFPSLLINESFITCLSTPIVKATKGQEVIKFYNLSDYDNWVENTNNSNKYKIKYYKGLGTSTKVESQEYFKEMKLIEYYSTEHSKTSINKVFNKKLANERKEWLVDYDKTSVIKLNSDSNTQVSFDDFVNLELKHFSNYDNCRSIPSVMDGLKPSQRKVLWSCFKKNLKNEIKVSQLAGYISEVSEYHHGEASLLGCIIGMAQDFVGTNNINLLCPAGQFGSRIQGGKDSASARYIFTNLEEIAFKLFNKLDEDLLTKKYEDNSEIEPEYYVPLLPMVLVNGAKGVGTGYSTEVLQYNPVDIISNIRKLIKGKELDEISPYYKGFKGEIVEESKNKYISYGIVKQLKKNVLEVSELPVGCWRNDYDTFLDKMCLDKKINSYEGYSDDVDIKYHINLNEDIKLTEDNMDEIMTKFKLKKPLNATNMVLYDKDNKLKKYDSVNDIIVEFYYMRLEYYVRRRTNLLDKYNYERLILENKIRFLTEVIGKKLIISNKPDEELYKELGDKDYYKKDDKYDYLLDMSMRSMTLKKINDLKEQLEKLLNKLEELNNKTERDLYKDDLKDFEKEYKKNE